MTLIEKLNKQLETVNLRFDVKKESNDKFKGELIDTKQGIFMEFEVDKRLQYIS